MITDTHVARKYLQIQQSAGDRGLEFDLSLQSVRNLLRAKKCYYTKQKLVRVNGHPRQITFDRVDNTKGYVKGNVVACCKSFNELKGKLTPEDIKILYKKVIL